MNRALIILILFFTCAAFGNDIELIQFSDLRLRDVNSSESALCKTWTLNRSKTDVATVTITFEPKQIYGSDGCNRYSGSISIAGSTLKIGPIMATRSVCESLKGSDSRFRRTLVAVDQYRITANGQLELLNASGEVLLTFHR